MTIAQLNVDSGALKMLREALCAAEGYLLRSAQYSAHGRHFSTLIHEIDNHRPLGSNGKHGTLHTRTCGCEDGELE